MVNQHATIGALFGVAVIAVWWLHRRRGATAELLELLTLLGMLIAAQGLVGAVQYELKLPAEMVWVHVALATATWVVLLWAAATEGRLRPAGVRGSLPDKYHASGRSADGTTMPADSLSSSVGEP